MSQITAPPRTFGTHLAYKRVKEIALAFPRGAHQELFIEGVLRYAADQECNWSYITAPESL
jgi:hypothetical protein